MHNGLPADASRPGLLKYIESGKCGPIFCSTPLKMWRVIQKTRRLFIFPSISHFEGIGQGGISREIPPRYFPDNTVPLLFTATLTTILVTADARKGDPHSNGLCRFTLI